MFKDYFAQATYQLQDNPFNILQNYPSVLIFLRTLWIFNYSQIGFGYIGERICNSLEQTLHQDIATITQGVTEAYKDRAFIDHCKNTRMSPNKMNFSFDVIEDYILTSERFLDFGCGRLALLRKLARSNPTIKALYGYDPKSHPKNLDFDPRAHYLATLDEVSLLRDIDVVHTAFVLHHLTREELEEALPVINSSLKQGGTFVVLEESFPEEKLPTADSFVQSKGYQIETSITSLFELLSTEERFLAIYINDLLANLKHLSYMPWTFEYRSIEEWVRFIEAYGFRVKEVHYFGIPQSGRVKQGPTALLEFQKI